MTPRQWGALTGAFHQAGRPPGHRTGRRAGRQAGPAGPYDPARVFGSRVRRARQLTGERGHPLHGAHALVRAFVGALEAAVHEAAAAAAGSDQLLVLGDNQPGNVMAVATPDHAGAGRPVLNDFERIATGPPALDLAAVVLGVQHFGYPPVVAEEFRAGYAAGSGSGAPTLREAWPFARIRELSGAVIAMIQAGDSPEMQREMHVRAVAVTEPGAGERWTYIGDPNAMQLRRTRLTPTGLAERRQRPCTRSKAGTGSGS